MLYVTVRLVCGSDIFMYAEKMGGNQIGSDTCHNGSNIIRYPTAILSPVLFATKVNNAREYLTKGPFKKYVTGLGGRDQAK